jgi:hypothetical protein
VKDIQKTERSVLVDWQNQYCENGHITKSMAMSLFFFFFFSLSSFISPKKQKTQYQSELNSAPSWAPTLWKASLLYTSLKKYGAISLCQLTPKLHV